MVGPVVSNPHSLSAVFVNGARNVVFLAPIKVGKRVALRVDGLAVILVGPSRDHGLPSAILGISIQTIIAAKDGPNFINLQSLRACVNGARNAVFLSAIRVGKRVAWRVE